MCFSAVLTEVFDILRRFVDERSRLDPRMNVMILIVSVDKLESVVQTDSLLSNAMFASEKNLFDRWRFQLI